MRRAVTKSQMLMWPRDTIWRQKNKESEEFVIRETMKTNFVSTLNRSRRGSGKKLSEPIFQEMTTKEKELQGAHQ